VESLFRQPRHPYTIGLMRSLPEHARRGEPLATIPGTVPDAAHLPGGCRFRTRCSLASERCAEAEPLLRVANPEDETHPAACHFLDEAKLL
jgi:oligopeptide/dipeptide ABC transporter ATP-binding protein